MSPPWAMPARNSDAMAWAHEATAARSEDDGGGKMWLKRVRGAVLGPGVEVGALVRCIGQTQIRLRGERDIGGTGEEPLDGAASDLGARVHQ
jgi:hypothetical protein